MRCRTARRTRRPRWHVGRGVRLAPRHRDGCRIRGSRFSCGWRPGAMAFAAAIRQPIRSCARPMAATSARAELSARFSAGAQGAGLRQHLGRSRRGLPQQLGCVFRGIDLGPAGLPAARRLAHPQARLAGRGHESSGGLGLSPRARAALLRARHLCRGLRHVDRAGEPRRRRRPGSAAAGPRRGLNGRASAALGAALEASLRSGRSQPADDLEQQGDVLRAATGGARRRGRPPRASSRRTDAPPDRACAPTARRGPAGRAGCARAGRDRTAARRSGAAGRPR